MSDLEQESVVVRDRSSRRRFIRRGAAFVAGGALISSTQTVYADDCDRNEGMEKNAQAPGSDSDTGESADPTGCGRRPKPKISNYQRFDAPENQVVKNNVKVAKIKS